MIKSGAGRTDGGRREPGSLPNGGGVLGTAILLIEDRTEVGSEGLRGKMVDASTSETGCSPSVLTSSNLRDEPYVCYGL